MDGARASLRAPKGGAGPCACQGSGVAVGNRACGPREGHLRPHEGPWLTDQPTPAAQSVDGRKLPSPPHS